MSTATLLSLPTDEPSSLLGHSTHIERLRQRIHKFAQSSAPVFIGGETGSGKELVARELHAQGPRRNKPFVALNCAALPIDLLESELFGHRKGSFTHAERDHAGLFQSAEGGSLFLDEVAELPLAVQAKLLRAVQEGRVRPLGATQERVVDLRLISASHRDLMAEVQAGRFRADLFYRLHVLSIHVPPLREHPDDLPALITHILSKFRCEFGKPFALTNEALELLHKLPFPGNVRELENLLHRACVLTDSAVLDASDFMALLEGDSDQPTSPPPERRTLDVLAHREIVRVLQACRWNRTRAAEQLGLSVRALRYRIQKFGIA